MATVFEVLERLSKARDRTQLSMIWNGFARHNTRNEKVMQSLTDIKKITNTWSRMRAGKIKKWR